MVYNKKYIIVACVFFMNTAPCTADAVSFMYSDDKLSWFEAQNKCRDINGNLFDPHLSNIRRLQRSCADEVPGKVWSGHYHALSHWIEFVGCYTELNRPKLQMKSQTTSDPLECQHLCQNSTYFGLFKGDICICFGSDNYVLGNKLEADAQHCHIRCTDRMSVFCGGHKAFSVYKTVSNKFSDKPGYDCSVEDCNCVSAECKQSGTTLKKEFYKQPCSAGMATVCSNNVLTAGESPHWTESLTRCATQENRYPISSDAGKEFCEMSTSTWTSIFRDVFVAKDELGVNLANVKYCTYINWRGDTVTTKQGNCDLKMEYICEVDSRSYEKNYDECQKITSFLEQQSDQIKTELIGVIVGIPVAVFILFVVVVVVGIVIVRKKRQSPKTKYTLNKNNEPSDAETKNTDLNEKDKNQDLTGNQGNNGIVLGEYTTETYL